MLFEHGRYAPQLAPDRSGEPSRRRYADDGADGRAVLKFANAIGEAAHPRVQVFHFFPVSYTHLTLPTILLV